jgi:exopolyphosphatase / guanosine-5'-triphosphate,3'-diphosphate pyrophosphatase
MPKIAAIDTGSNAIRLIIANLDEDKKVETLETIRVPIRLGLDAFRKHEFSETTIQQVVDTFLQFNRVIEDFGVSQVKAVATSAVREAANGQVLVDRIKNASGIDLEIIVGEEEARLVYLAVCSSMQLSNKRAVMIDIGGGSVEITLTRGNTILVTNSYQLGTVRLLQNLYEEKTRLKPLIFSSLLRESILSTQRYMQADIGTEPIDLCVGTGGNVEEIGLVCQKLRFSDSADHITALSLRQLNLQLCKMTEQERMRKFGLKPDRADVILPAALVLEQVVNIAGTNDIYIPNVGLKNGILIDMANNFARETNSISADQIRESAFRIGHKFQFDEKHAAFVAKMAVELFDQTLPLHQMGNQERFLLEIGAILHDIGHFIGTVDHDQHGAYILSANHLIGLNETQQKMVAALVKFHRKGYPYREDSVERNLSVREKVILTKLAAFLRLADALDASHQQKITDVNILNKNSSWYIFLNSEADIAYEKWALSKKSSLFCDIFGQSLEIVNR